MQDTKDSGVLGVSGGTRIGDEDTRFSASGNSDNVSTNPLAGLRGFICDIKGGLLANFSVVALQGRLGEDRLHQIDKTAVVNTSSDNGNVVSGEIVVRNVVVEGTVVDVINVPGWALGRIGQTRITESFEVSSL